MEELTIPGVSIAFINDGAMAYHNTYGFANVENGIEIDATTIFEGASLSKSVFAYFVMTFVDKAQLDLDQPLYKYLPYEDIADDDRYKDITARMVLSHRTGFPNWRENEKDGKLQIKFDPGSDYLYSGEGFQYLALVLKTIASTDWAGLEAIFQERVAIPLNLEHTVFIQNEYTRQNKAEPYDEQGNWIDWKNDYWYIKNDSVFVAAASIHSESVDFARWMVGVMDDKILSPERYEELLKPHSLIEESDFYNVDYTLGFVHLDIPLTDFYSHGGNNEGFTSWFALDKSKKWGYVLFTNSEGGEALGNNLLMYMLAGPDKKSLYLVIGFLLVAFLAVIGFSIFMLLKAIKGKRSSAS